jgi:hypothetical protein
MKKLLYIQACIDHPELLAHMVEQLASRKNIDGVDHAMLKSWIIMQTSSTEAFASGTVDIKNKEDIVHNPFTTSFLFTCRKSANNYYLTWCMGMN